MSLNANLIDSRVLKLSQDLKDELELRLNIKGDEHKAQSATFVYLVAKLLLDLTEEEALDTLTDGGQDFGIDAIHIGDVDDIEFPVTLFQGKYKQKLDAQSGFPQSGIEKIIQALRYIFDPHIQLSVNPVLRKRLEEVRSFILEGYLPKVRVVLCNNGQTWNADCQKLINLANQEFSDATEWKHVNHDYLVHLQQNPKSVAAKLHLSGASIVEDFEYSRILIGKLPIQEIASLFNQHGDLLLEKNVRRFLGLQKHRVNKEISETLKSPIERANFYFYNNGITLICDKFTLSAYQGINHIVHVEGLQVINGGQTCKTIQQALSEMAGSQQNLDKAFVLVRLYQLPSESEDLVRSITYATNSQNPVDLRDLRSNDVRQKSLQVGLNDLGYTYHRYRSESSLGAQDISSAVAAAAVLSVWRERPHQARFQGREHFGKLYDLIFSDALNATQLVLATLIYRYAENQRRKNTPDTPDFASYASCFIAMLMGRYLLKDLNLKLNQLSHRQFEQAKAKWEENQETYFSQALVAIEEALKHLYAENISLQRLSATFRRGDLLELLKDEGKDA